MTGRVAAVVGDGFTGLVAEHNGILTAITWSGNQILFTERVDANRKIGTQIEEAVKNIVSPPFCMVVPASILNMPPKVKGILDLFLLNEEEGKKEVEQGDSDSNSNNK